MSARILIVDDASDVRTVARMILDRAGYVTDDVASGEEALQRLSDEPLPDLVLLDLRMPGIDGWAVLAAIRRNPHYEQVRDIPVVIFTAHAKAGDDPRLGPAERQSLLTKPFRPAQLLDRVAQALGGAAVGQS